MKTNRISYHWEVTLPESGKGLFGGFEVAPSTQVKMQQTNCFPVATTSSEPGFDSGNRELAKGLFSQPISNTDFFSIPPSNSANKFSTLRMVPPSRGPFDHMAPDLPPFVSPRAP